MSAATKKIQKKWKTYKDLEAKRFEGIVRHYKKKEVERLQGSLKIEHTLADHAAKRFWELLHNEDYVAALGAVTGNQAVQMVRGGLQAIYMSGWQVAADNNSSLQTYPDQSLYPYNSVPQAVKRINAALRRADLIADQEGKHDHEWFAPIIADAEAGFGGPLNVYELVSSLIEAGAGGIHLEDQLSSEKKCGHLGGKVLVPTKQFIRSLIAARLAMDVAGVPTILIARTDANAAQLLTSDVDERDRKFIIDDKRTEEGFHRVKGGIEACIARGLAYAPYADMLWVETSKPDIEEARQFADAIHKKFPNKMLAYNCSPSFNWRANLSDDDIKKFQWKLAEMGYKYQFITLAGFHSLNFGMFDLARKYKDEGMWAYSRLQNWEFNSEKYGYTATRHQHEVGTGYFDEVSNVISGGTAATLALKGSTEEEQF